METAIKPNTPINVDKTFDTAGDIVRFFHQFYPEIRLQNYFATQSSHWPRKESGNFACIQMHVKDAASFFTESTKFEEFLMMVEAFTTTTMSDKFVMMIFHVGVDFENLTMGNDLCVNYEKMSFFDKVDSELQEYSFTHQDFDPKFIEAVMKTIEYTFFSVLIQERRDLKNEIKELNKQIKGKKVRIEKINELAGDWLIIGKYATDRILSGR